MSIRGRGALIGIVAAMAGAIAYVHGRSAPAPSTLSVRIARESVVVTNTSREDVRVHHELIRVPAPVPAPIRSPVRLTRLTRGATPQPGVLAKARRLFVGNGRYRPQPFPTVRP